LAARKSRPIVEKVVVTGNPLLAARADRPNISTGRESQVSVQHAVAAALVTGKAGLEQFTDACVNDPAVRALRGKVEVVRDEKYSTTIAAAVEITDRQTANAHLVAAAARGSDKNPMSDRDLEEKLRDAAAELESAP
jgi:2-methylcitrate dehydratase PrpD